MNGVSYMRPLGFDDNSTSARGSAPISEERRHVCDTRGLTAVLLSATG